MTMINFYLKSYKKILREENNFTEFVPDGILDLAIDAYEAATGAVKSAGNAYQVGGIKRLAADHLRKMWALGDCNG